MVAAGPVIAYLHPASRLVANSRYGFAKGKLVNGLRDPRSGGLSALTMQCSLGNTWNGPGIHETK